MMLRSIAMLPAVALAYPLPYPSQPKPCPGEFQAENCQAGRYKNERRARRNNHHDANQQNRYSDDCDCHSFYQFDRVFHRIHRPLSNFVRPDNCQP